jgi:hypothetical protein
MKKYLPAFLLFVALTGVLLFLSIRNTSHDEQNSSWFIFIYFILITVTFHYGIVLTTKSRPQVFIRYYMASTTIRLLIHLGVIVLFSVLHKNFAVRFILTFMVMYFLFTLFEVLFVWRTMKK